jgi:hypothetical protein
VAIVFESKGHENMEGEKRRKREERSIVGSLASEVAETSLLSVGLSEERKREMREQGRRWRCCN